MRVTAGQSLVWVCQFELIAPWRTLYSETARYDRRCVSPTSLKFWRGIEGKPSEGRTTEHLLAWDQKEEERPSCEELLPLSILGRREGQGERGRGVIKP